MRALWALPEASMRALWWLEAPLADEPQVVSEGEHAPPLEGEAQQAGGEQQPGTLGPLALSCAVFELVPGLEIRARSRVP